MTRRYDPDKHHRRSIRMPDYDYSQPGAYFVTICTQNRECFFGHVLDGQMQLNDAGHVIQSVWDALPEHYPGVDIDAFVVMPNHIHGIIILTDAAVGARPRACPDPGPRACPDSCVRPDAVAIQSGHLQGDAPTTRIGQSWGVDGQPRGVAPTGRMSLPDVVHRFKSLTTARYRHGVYEHGWQPFPGRLWQRNYYEHIIRNERALQRIREYILNNPARWDLDIENPDAWQCGKAPDAARYYAAIWGEPP